MNKQKGKFIVFEHLDGAGGTTQAKNYASNLKELGIPTEFTCEPTDSKIGRYIRSLQSHKSDNAHLLPYLYIADRALHAEQIQELLNEGTWVVCDRYWYSSVAYQGTEWEEINSRFPVPDEVIYIKLPVKECIQRIEARGKGKDVFETQEFLSKSAAVYDELAERYGFTVVDGTGSVEEVATQIRRNSKSFYTAEMIRSQLGMEKGIEGLKEIALDRNPFTTHIEVEDMPAEHRFRFKCITSLFYLQEEESLYDLTPVQYTYIWDAKVKKGDALDIPCAEPATFLETVGKLKKSGLRSSHVLFDYYRNSKEYRELSGLTIPESYYFIIGCSDPEPLEWDYDAFPYKDIKSDLWEWSVYLVPMDTTGLYDSEGNPVYEAGYYYWRVNEK